MSDFWQSYLEKEAQRQEEARGFLYAACTKLKDRGVVEVHFSYDGSGDSGWITEVVARDASGEIVPLTEDVQGGLEEAVVSFLPGGWEINEGSRGTATLNVSEVKLDFDHYNRVRGSEDEVEEWSF